AYGHQVERLYLTSRAYVSATGRPGRAEDPNLSAARRALAATNGRAFIVHRAGRIADLAGLTLVTPAASKPTRPPYGITHNVQIKGGSVQTYVTENGDIALDLNGAIGRFAELPPIDAESLANVILTALREADATHG